MIKKIEGLRRIYIGKLPDGDARDIELAKYYGYNQAIDDVIKLLNMHFVSNNECNEVAVCCCKHFDIVFYGSKCKHCGGIICEQQTDC